MLCQHALPMTDVENPVERISIAFVAGTSWRLGTQDMRHREDHVVCNRVFQNEDWSSIHGTCLNRV